MEVSILFAHHKAERRSGGGSEVGVGRTKVEVGNLFFKIQIATFKARK